MSDPACGEFEGSGSGDSAILSVEEVHQGRDSSEGTEGEGSYIRAFRVIVAHSQVTAKTVRDADGIPEIGDTYSVTYNSVTTEDTSSVAVDKHAFHPDPDSQTLWHVVVSYDRSGKPSGDTKTARWTTQKYTRPAFRTVNASGLINQADGDPIVNSAGDPFVPPVEIEESRLVYHRSYWVADGLWDEDELQEYKDAINSNTVTIGTRTFAARTLRITEIDGVRAKRGNAYWWQVSLVVEVREETWDVYLQDRGFRHINETGDLVETTDCAGQPLSEPAFLDGDGGLLVPCEDAGALSGSYPDPVILDPFQVYRLKSFGGLDLDHAGDS